MTKVYLLCTPAGICSSMLCYILNQSSECHNSATSDIFRPCINLFIDKIFTEDDYEKSDVTVNDRWNFPDQLSPGDRQRYTHEIRNNVTISKEQAEWVSSTFNIDGKSIFLFSHAQNIKEIQEYSIDGLEVIQAVHGPNFINYVHLWLGRTVLGYYRDKNFNEIMSQSAEYWIGKLDKQITYCKNLNDGSIPIIEVQEWLDGDLSNLYQKVGVNLPINIKLVEEVLYDYKKRNTYNHKLLEDIKHIATEQNHVN